MPRRLRVSTAGLFFHVVNRAAKRVPLFECDADYAAFERVLIEAVSRTRIAIFAYCLMPNHWHLVVSPLEDGHLSRFMHWLTTTHARRWQTIRGLDGHGAVYQGRFKATAIKDDDHFLWVCRYVERNALRASLVPRAEDWRWSSLRLRRKAGGEWLSEWPVRPSEDWLTWVNMPQTDREVAAFRLAMRTGDPFGDHMWQERIRTVLGLTSPRGRGRPPRTARATVLNK
jgi:putative transposase